MASVEIAGIPVGHGHRVFIIGEIGINHNGSMDVARKLIDGAAEAGCDAVKFQKRTPELCVPREQWDIERDTPWGRMRYIDYRYKVEFDEEQYREIDSYCRQQGILWFASCWDEKAVAFMESFSPPCYKVSSASLTDRALLGAVRQTGRPVILSTGMSTLDEIDDAVDLLGRQRLLLAHTNSSYPCPVGELNLKMIPSLQKMYPDVPVGYSGHEVGLATTWAAVALGAVFVERHITLDRAMWGSDQAASVEISGLKRLVSDIRDIEKALGDGVKRLYDGELAARKKLRRV
ncbi:N-acetylneuraminate synthase family protein [Prosthecochloris sp. HL-130-GSB]|jgi:N-acetylneuraminate synthase|uniref:N-acetylneuraminate synthase family protein n=1 Tax=Prosthecochloris sp. HL-130-GSB TaxID=1974213 RepID=UPI000A1C1647|nr:N-acetylneuraminate synthase family protein [Prosthecochloris sp. HL-130-GSB]ARM31034.1 N-acetylneuraminate synthase [Prosthecochloris sp. HL-130-GSB]